MRLIFFEKKERILYSLGDVKTKRINWIDTATLAGNVTDMLSFMEPLYREGFDTHMYLGGYRDESDRVLSFHELYKLWNTLIPEDHFHLFKSKEELGDLNGFTIGGGPHYEGLCDLIKVIFPFRRREGTEYFSPHPILGEKLGVRAFSRPLREIFWDCEPRERVYDFADAVALNEKKGLGVLKRLGRHFSGVVCVSLQRPWQKELLGLGNSVELVINASAKKVREIFSKSKLFIHPSETEQVSCALDEALSCGCYPILREGASPCYEDQVPPKSLFFTDFHDLVRKVRDALDGDLDHESIRRWTQEAMEDRERSWLKFIKEKLWR